MRKFLRAAAVCLSGLSCLFLVACAAPRTPLNDAVVAGDAARVAELVERGGALDELGACGDDAVYGDTPLICAIDKDRPQIARLLIERGAKVDEPSEVGCPPLMSAAQHDAGIAALLLDRGASVEGRCVGWLEGRTALMNAAIAGKIDVVRLLIDRGADVNAKTSGGYGALNSAAYKQRVDIARLLVAKGADIDAAIEKAEADAAEESETSAKDRAAARLLKELKANYRACAVRYRPDPALLSSFGETVAKYRAAPAKPELPEAARAFRVQAEDAVAQLRLQDAVDRYGKALGLAPWWPEGHFNQALLLGEADCPEEAIAAMERYLALVPEAPDARAARDKVYLWKGRLP